MRFLRRTKDWSNWWLGRKMDWANDYSKSWNHPHRYMLAALLQSFNWVSLIEVGCASGPNLINFVRTLGNKQLGGVDIVPEAIEEAQKTFRNGMFKVCPADDIMLSDNSTDVVLTDMTLIYVGWNRIDKHIAELKRVARHYVVLCEFNSSSFWQRLRLKIRTGYNAYDYEKLLKKHGFYNIKKFKIPNEIWPKEDGTPSSDEENQFRWITIAKKPKHG